MTYVQCKKLETINMYCSIRTVSTKYIQMIDNNKKMTGKNVCALGVG